MMIISFSVDNVALELGGGWALNDYSFGAAVASEILFAISLTLIIGMLLHVQTNLNQYWASLKDAVIVPSKVSAGEVLCVLFGVFAWSDTLQSLLSESYRSA